VIRRSVARATRIFSPWTVLGTWRDDAKVRVEPFETFELELADLWAMERDLWAK
jgi:hypothetical protein